ncbi:cytochrome P450 [Aspergillus pseudoustus]|uniref:Cytochrome P450 n=1 Tax=Aspergillus pseudoustus TaxID=1810923 RepID=A0ABR4J132_9EURO
MLGLYSAGCALAATLFLYQIGCFVYNLYLHPLRNYPGPRLAAISRLPLTYTTLCGHSAFWIHKLHQKYGPVVRVAPSDLSYTDQRAWNDIYGSTPAHPLSFPRDPGLFHFLNDEEHRPSIGDCDGDEHRRIRRAYAPAFSKRALAEQEPLFQRYADALVTRGMETQGNVANVSELFAHTFFDIIGHLNYGESLGVLEKGTNRSWADSQLWLLPVAGCMEALVDFAVVRLLLEFVLVPATRSARETVHGQINARLDKRLAEQDSERRDVVGIAFQSSRKTCLTERDIRANAVAIMVAGAETLTAFSILFTAKLFQHPKVMARLTTEIRTAFQNSSDVTFASTARLPYLEACIKEAMRLNPANVFKRLVPKGGATVLGHWLPEGIRVYAAPLATMRSPDNFRKAEMFIPERWLDFEGTEFESDNRAAYQPFSLGPRNCIGQEMAYSAARLVICKMLLNFDIAPALDVDKWTRGLRAWTTWSSPPLLVHLTPAQSNNAVGRIPPSREGTVG